ncbi:MAG: HEAT repeat domain-containing protein [Deltaproteobacteria bacterium]|nr:HEAT repeat domain-containing protein [Deltaproteobacteria bacterium]
MRKNWIFLVLIVAFLFCVLDSEGARRKRKARRRYPSPTHPVVLWARTLSQSVDPEERKVAAFKLSQYSLPIFQTDVVERLIGCMKDPDVHIKVLCAKAMSRAGRQSDSEWVRNALVAQYQADPILRNTIVRTFIARKDSSPQVHDLLVNVASKSTDHDELLVLVSYFENFGFGSGQFVDVLTNIYKNSPDIKIKRGVAKALGGRGQGQESVVTLLTDCTQSKDTPLQLICLEGLQLQVKKDSRLSAAVGNAISKTIESEDLDVLMATLDVVNVLPENPDPKVSQRLVEIIESVDDPDLQEKAVLALGVMGDGSDKTVGALQKLLEKKDGEEATRIAAALVLGKQAYGLTEKPRELLSKCKDERSQSLRTACQLGLQELESRKAKNKGVAPSTREIADNPSEKPSSDKVKP